MDFIRSASAQSLDERHIRFLEPELSPVLKVDRRTITGILRNLVDNAPLFRGDRMSEMRVGYEADDNFHILSVSDNGAGIETEDSQCFSVRFGVESEPQKRTKFCVAIPKNL